MEKFVRRSFLRLAAGGFTAFVQTAGTAAQAGAAKADRPLTSPIKPLTQAAIDRGLAWLANQQGEDGAFGEGGYARNVAVVSLGAMALLSAGDAPGRGQYGAHLHRCLDYVLKAADDSGFLCDPRYTSHGPMYDHGFATLLLAETYGVSTERSLRDKLARAVRLIVATQNQEGGWRYHPRVGEADISVTACQVMALRAARNAGIHVPAVTIDRSIDYIKRCQNADGGFMYMLDGGPSRFPRSAAAIAGLFSAGIYESEEVRKGLEYLMQRLPTKEEVTRDTHAMYGQYYAALVMWQSGGERWQKWYPAVEDALLKQQQADGSWQDLICSEYGTAMACIILQLPNEALPIFQR